MKRMTILLALVMAVVLVLSAPMAEAKKKKKKSSPAFEVVKCPTEPDKETCIGTSSDDYLRGKAGEVDRLQGKEGNDVYDGKGGSKTAGDRWEDESLTSNDYYLISAKGSGTSGDYLTIEDEGGDLDVLDLSRFYEASDFTIDEGNDYDGDGKNNDTLLDNGPGSNNIILSDDGDEGHIEVILFADGPMIREA